MKKGWEIKKLGEVCDVLNGYAFKSSNYVDKGTRIIRITNVQKGIVVDEDPKYYSDKDMNGLIQYQLYENDLLMSLTGNVGRVGLLSKDLLPAALNQRVACLRVKDKSICLYYLFHYLNSSIFENEAILSSTGIAQKNMSTEWLKKHNIPIPPLSEQERIVEELDCLSGVIEKKKEQLKELDALAQSIFYEMFGNPVENDRGWEVKKIKDIAIVKIGPFGSLLHTSDYVCGGIPLVNPIHMCEEKVCADINFTVSKDKIGELQNYILHAGDIVFARRGDIGRCALIRDVDNGYLCGTGSLFVRMVEDVNTVFFIKMMRCGMIIKSLNSLAKGATMLNINCKIIEDFSVILPPIFLQQQFAEKIKKIEKQKELIRKSIEEVEMLFNSSMEYYFG